MMRTSLDLSPLYRSAIGFDRMARLLDSAATDSKPSYPPYNVELVEENRYRISMAVAGKQADSAEHKYLYQGIAERNFERKFQLDEHVHVIDARLENGLLHIELERELPEAMKPRKIAISDGNNGNLLEQDAA